MSFTCKKFSFFDFILSCARWLGIHHISMTPKYNAVEH